MQADKYIFWVFAGFFIGMIIFSYVMNTTLLRLIKTLGVRDSANLVRWSSRKKPAIGGIGFFIVFLLASGSYSIFFDPQEVFKNTGVLGVLGFTSIAFLMGLADDAYDTRPWMKFAVQFICGIGTIATGNVIHIFDSEWANYILTIFWIVGIMNSVNMLDNMDGITGTVSLFIGVMLLLIMNFAHRSDSFDFYLVMGVIAAIIGFLYFNWHPSKMYMGDTGSQFLGYFLGALGIKYCWNAGDFIPQITAEREVLLAAVVFLLTMADTTAVTISRLRARTSPFVGGKDHTTHNLSYLGLTDSQVAFVFIGLSGVLALIVTAILMFVDEWSMSYYYVIIVILSAIFITLLGLTVYHNHKRRKNEVK